MFGLLYQNILKVFKKEKEMSYRENADETLEDDGLTCYYVSISYIVDGGQVAALSRYVLAIDRLDAIEKVKKENKIHTQKVYFHDATSIDILIKQEKVLRKKK